jgi:acyl-coenzyme A synthetase/AMP-(fatty) acid ligase
MHTSVAETAVIGTTDEFMGQAIFALVTLTPLVLFVVFLDGD